MSKKSKRAKQPGRMKQLRQGSLAASHVRDQLVSRIQYAQQQMLTGDFAGSISTCEPLLNSLPRNSEFRLEVLALLGLAHGMQKHYQQSYAIFSEAITIDPANAEFWHNHGLACHYMGRPGEAVRDFERAVELSKDNSSDMAGKFVTELEVSWQELRELMRAYEPGITLEQYIEYEERFTQAMGLVKQEKWREAELLFRQLTRVGGLVPSYWGNLGVSLLMQSRYDEAEETFKQALAIAPDYSIARDNLKKLPAIRRSKQSVGLELINTYRDEDIKQSLSLYEKDAKGEIAAQVVIEKTEHAMTGTWRRIGKQYPRYNFFLNPYQDTRFTTCPHCKIKTRPRKFSLVVNVASSHTMIADKICRYCYICGLLIVHQDQLEDLLATNCMAIGQQGIIGSDYLVLGTLDRAEWNREKHDPISFEQVVEYLHDFKEVVAFERVQ